MIGVGQIYMETTNAKPTHGVSLKNTRGINAIQLNVLVENPRAKAHLAQRAIINSRIYRESPA